MSRNWTDEQRACIDARGGTVLVSAAAGSGKTSVLVERVIQRITDDEHPVDADRLLVVTFTKAAAAEMKQRLSAALTKKIAADPFNRRLQRQQMLLPRAQISTVHSFCSSLLRDNFHLLGISPRFQVAAEADVKLLRQEALGEVLEAAYAEKDPGFTRLADLILGARGDRPLRDAVTRLYDFIQSHAFPEEWMARQEARYADADPTGSDWGGAVHGYVLQALLYSLSLMRAAEEMAIADEAMNAAYGPTFTAERQMLQDAAGAFADADWDTGRAICRGIAFGRLPGLRNYPDPAYKERVTDLRGRAKKTAESLGNLLCGTAAECRQDVASTRPVVSALCALVRAFSDRYEQKKAERRWVDFNDLEHMALRLLLTKDENGDTARTPLARELAAYYEEVLVDEYQDTNEAQDALFRAVSRDETNLFMVGDVKQSIYGFRQAMPEIFLRRQDFYLPYDGRHFPAAITLGHNFRSRKEVTDGVNFVFSQLMSRDLGGLTYDERHALIYSAQGYSDAPGYQTELCLIDDDREDLDTKDAAEARWIAGRIHELLPTLRIKSEDGDRPAQYGDFCILLRSKSSHAAAYVEELNRQGIPAWTDVSGGFFGAPEVASAVALLRLLDNPTQDVSLLAVLLSPIGNFLPDDLAILRSHRRKAPLYVALREYARAGTDENLRERCRRFSGKMEEYRRLATALPADQLIHRLLEETGLLAAAAARVNGEQRLANLRLLHDFARRFEQGKFRGLSAFVRYVDRLEEQREDLAPASTLSGQSNVVRIISVHHSKGLEFPVVFLAGMGHKFNNDSTKGDLLLQSDQGIGLVWRDPATRRQYDTLPREAVKLAIRQAERAEDLRVLYVAMTRAKEKLCMVATCADVAKMLSKMAATVGDRPTVSAYALQNAASMGEWMMMAALRHPSGEELRRLASAPDLPVLPCDTPWEITVCASPAVTQAKTQAESPLPDPALTARYQQRLAYRYPYAALAAIPSKLAASALSHEALETRHVAEQRPAFLERQPLSAAGRGTAMHTFMERADFHRAGQDVRREADRLALEGVLTADQRQSLNVRRLAGFFESELCARMLASPRWLREQAFTVELPPAFFGYAAPEDMPNEKIVVQGIADSVFWEDGEWVIVDYKTDAVKTGAELVERYRDQLRIYKAALEQTLSRPVRECWLYAFSLGEAIKCDL